MPAGALAKISAARAADICPLFPLTEQASLMLTDELSPKQFLDLLMERSLYPDATRLLAYGLPKRDAVWWACLCLREALGANSPAKVRDALETAEKWVKNPSEETRRPALGAAEDAGLGTPAGLTALAAFSSGSDLAPADAPRVSPNEHLTAEAVAGAILLAAAGAEPSRVAERHRCFLTLGITVAREADENVRQEMSHGRT
ncbi:MAG: hypothetical protein L0215_11305 [Gemmataceae bacterium]|nr:hypothetical protein [Gemmataceae bacterium]